MLPLADPPFPSVILVHGSGKDSAVDTYYMAYLFASHGIATLAYDKRGTGGSSGEYNQNFHLLSDDTVAAVEWLRDRSEIDPRQFISPATAKAAGYPPWPPRRSMESGVC